MNLHSISYAFLEISLNLANFHLSRNVYQELFLKNYKSSVFALLSQTTKQLLSNFQSPRSSKYKQRLRLVATVDKTTISIVRNRWRSLVWTSSGTSKSLLSLFYPYWWRFMPQVIFFGMFSKNGDKIYVELYPLKKRLTKFQSKWTHKMKVS